jgi:hypothetical protein
MKIKDILKELEKLKDNEEKVQYLKEVLEEINDKELIKEINILIDTLKEDLEEKLSREIVIPVTRKRDLELNEIEQDIEVQERQVARPRQVIRQDIVFPREEDEKETRYETVSPNYKPVSASPTYQVNRPFSSYDNISLQNQVDTKLVEEILVKERDFNIGQVINDFQREEIRDTIDKFIPNASMEEKIKAEQQVIYDMKFKNKDLKYITKLR